MNDGLRLDVSIADQRGDIEIRNVESCDASFGFQELFNIDTLFVPRLDVKDDVRVGLQVESHSVHLEIRDDDRTSHVDLNDVVVHNERLEVVERKARKGKVVRHTTVLIGIKIALHSSQLLVPKPDSTIAITELIFIEPEEDVAVPRLEDQTSFERHRRDLPRHSLHVARPPSLDDTRHGLLRQDTMLLNLLSQAGELDASRDFFRRESLSPPVRLK
jgi:hypothetical protein